MTKTDRPPLPPFTRDTAKLKTRLAEDAWNSRDPADENGSWYRSYGNENWAFSASGHMQTRIASINDLQIDESRRKFHRPIGRRPDDHSGLSEMGL